MKASFAMAIHFHQPVGNFDHVIERACDKCYVPFLETLKRYPEIKINLHFSGCLLEWLEAKRPEIIGMIREMIKTGQVEIMSGGFSEPILSLIPPGDRLRQIKMLNDYIRTNFSFDPKGAWIAERVWEPDMPSVLYDAEIKYVILDDTHFRISGIPKDKTYGYYITEDNAKPVVVFPSDKILRYLIPFKAPAECMDYMSGVLRDHNGALFVYGDDGEKFGEWPGTHELVFRERWLENFFDELIKNTDWLNTVKLSEYLKEKPPLGKAYLSAASYEEMLEWVLPVETRLEMEKVVEDMRASGKEDRYRPFIMGGFWRNFLVKYPESDHMNKKMVYVSRKLERSRSGRRWRHVPLLEEAEKELFRGQCNCAYWHGVFGGLYLYHLRRAVYHHLIRSEVLMDRLLHGRRQFCEAVVADIDADGQNEAVLENRDISLYFDPAEGGILKELDSKTVCQNLINSLARREEAYHRNIVENTEPGTGEASHAARTIHDGIRAADTRMIPAPPERGGMREYLDYDRYSRYSLIDHFLGNGVDIEAFSRCVYDETGDFINGVYDLEVEPRGRKKSRGAITLVLKREGLAAGSRICLVKRITLPAKGAYFTVQYSITNLEDSPADLLFGPEFNLTMPDADSDRYSLVFDDGSRPRHLGDTVQCEETGRILVRDDLGELSFEMTFSEKCRLWHFPVKTVSRSEKGYELIYQSSVLFPHLRIKLGGGEEKRFGLKISLQGGTKLK